MMSSTFGSKEAFAQNRRHFIEDGLTSLQFDEFAPIPFASAASAPSAFIPLSSASALPVTLPNLSKVSAGSDQAMMGDTARSRYNVSGTGVRVGILSDSFNLKGGAAAGVGRGDLPTGVSILREGPGGSGDEGRAMAELVHKVAPGAQISFYSAFNGAADFANGILALARAGAKVIVDDVTYLNEPFFQAGGVISKAVQQVVAAGVHYFTSASNQGTNFYQSGFNGVRTALPGISGNFLAQNFGTSTKPSTTQSLTVARGATVTLDLQWDQPFASISPGKAAANSLGMVLYDSNNRVVAAAMRNDVGGDPVQILQYTNTGASTGFRLAIVTNGGSTAPGLFKYIAYGQGTTINDSRAGIGSGTIIGHEMVNTANVVGATNYAGTQRFGGADRVESFSSVGPGTTLFDASGNRLAAPLTGTGVDYVAPDGSTTSVFSPFFGTSAAAPNAAAVAALMLQANPNLSPAQLSTMLAQSAISAIGPAGSTGAGLIQADRAVLLARATSGAGGGTSVSSATVAGGASGTAVRSDYAAAQDLLADVTADPASNRDLYAGLDLASGQVDTAAAQTYGGAMSMVLTNNASLAIPTFVDETRFV